MPLRVDVHQHLWTEPLIEALSRRNKPPYVRLRGEGWTVTVPGEPDSLLERSAVGIEKRAEELVAEGFDLALVSLSSALGVEGLPPEEAQPLIDAYSEGVSALPSPFKAWGVTGLRSISTGTVEELLADGLIGLSLPAGALKTPAALERVGPLLELLERCGAPLFVHPGPSPWAPAEGPSDPLPLWWPALTDYIDGMVGAWLTFTVFGRKRYPALKVLFAMLAGGGPIQLERLASRGVEIDPVDTNTFYDSSSYGPRAVAAVAAYVGVRQIVYGSDRPVVPHSEAFDGSGIDRDGLARNGQQLIEQAVAAV